mmetsp:Transcript_14522/g.49905  ORF Transcript_14522/g.49905 Transcript_14522/m.49905 type:complete len:214 (-) Transcript_14522:998-1639(-)
MRKLREPRGEATVSTSLGGVMRTATRLGEHSGELSAELPCGDAGNECTAFGELGAALPPGLLLLGDCGSGLSPCGPMSLRTLARLMATCLRISALLPGYLISWFPRMKWWRNISSSVMRWAGSLMSACLMKSTEPLERNLGVLRGEATILCDLASGLLSSNGAAPTRTSKVSTPRAHTSHMPSYSAVPGLVLSATRSPVLWRFSGTRSTSGAM